MVELERGAYYMVPEKSSNRVVRLHGIGKSVVVLREAEGEGRWTVKREPFEQRLRDGNVREVTPRWEPAGEAVTV